MSQVGIKKLNSQLQGIGYLNDKIIFVPKTIPGEICEVEVLKEKKRFQEGKVTRVLENSEKRTLPRCPYYETCGGCDLEHIIYEESILWKQNMLQELFEKQNLWNQGISVLPCSNPWNYRNKVSLKVRNGTFGFYDVESHSFVKIQECQIAEKAINEVLKDFSLFSFSNGELVIRVNENDEVLMDFITSEEVSIEKSLVDRHKIVGILINHKCVYGKPYFFERKNSVLYQVHMNSFFQVNPLMSTELFWYVRKYLKNARNVLDLYCGVGTLGLQLDKERTRLIGIEVVESAILNAITNARLNHFKNTSFHLGKVEQIIDKIDVAFDAIIVDPPRSGLDKVTKETILKINPKTILYVSCNPLTLVRDLKDMSGSYEIQSIQGFDMFPFTRHVECVTLLSLKK